MRPHLGQPWAYRSRAVLEVDAGDVGQRGHPRQHVGELLALLRDRALPQGLRQLADLLGQPGHARRQTPFTVARPIGAVHQVLQLGQVHGRRG